MLWFEEKPLINKLICLINYIYNSYKTLKTNCFVEGHNNCDNIKIMFFKFYVCLRLHSKSENFLRNVFYFICFMTVFTITVAIKVILLLVTKKKE